MIEFLAFSKFFNKETICIHASCIIKSSIIFSELSLISEIIQHLQLEIKSSNF